VQANEWRVSVPGAEYLNQLAPARIVSLASPSRCFPTTRTSRNNDRPHPSFFFLLVVAIVAVAPWPFPPCPVLCRHRPLRLRQRSIRDNDVASSARLYGLCASSPQAARIALRIAFASLLCHGSPCSAFLEDNPKTRLPLEGPSLIFLTLFNRRDGKAKMDEGHPRH